MTMSAPNATPLSTTMFRPPVNHTMRVLDRSFFDKKITIAAARIFENKQITKHRSELRRDLLQLGRISTIVPDPNDADRKNARKILLLKPEIRPDDSSTWSDTLRDLVSKKQVDVTQYVLALDYSYWTYYDIMSSILPEDDQEELPSGFSIVGHVAHLNLREQYFPYKHLIASVLMDKNPSIKSVINKIDDVGTHSEFRTFKYELLAGDPSLNVELREQDCTFRFDYSKVYWNSRLNTEHERLVNFFNPGDAVCDVMAGVGPFAIPAGKRRVFVWANDLNPEGYVSLQENITMNKVAQFVKAFNVDGREFIRVSAKKLLAEDEHVEFAPRQRRSSKASNTIQETVAATTVIHRPKTFHHYVMNLPATAVTFLDAFNGLYHGHESLFMPQTSTKLPMIHVYCFSAKSDDEEQQKINVCREVSKYLGYTIKPEDEDTEVWDVRNVAPNKRMICATFRLPREVAFR